MQVYVDNPLVSIVIPVKDRPKELERAIGSVLVQTYQNIEVIVVENNSKDSASVDRIVGSFENDAIHCYHLAPCANTNVARNFGVSKSSGHFIAFLDSDDEWMPDHLLNTLKVIFESEADFVYGAGVIDDGQSKITRNAWAFEDHPVNYLLGSDNGFAPTPSFVVSALVFRRVLWDETLSRHQDYDFFIRCALAFKVAVNTNPDIVIHWVKGDIRNFNFDSMIDFYYKWRKSMSLETEVRFLKGTVKLCLSDRSYKKALRLIFSYFFAWLRRL